MFIYMYIYYTVSKISTSTVQYTTKHVYIGLLNNLSKTFLSTHSLYNSAEPPSFTATPQPVVKVAVGQDVTLTCSAFGTKPLIKWTTPNVSNRLAQQPSGNLLIKV